jgi:hypothetical protein
MHSTTTPGVRIEPEPEQRSVTKVWKKSEALEGNPWVLLSAFDLGLCLLELVVSFAGRL